MDLPDFFIDTPWQKFRQDLPEISGKHFDFENNLKKFKQRCQAAGIWKEINFRRKYPALVDRKRAKAKIADQRRSRLERWIQAKIKSKSRR